LDNFWKEDLGRERLSSPKRRIKIALDVFTAIRFLHEGSKSEGIAACFHRDIKSANICLKRDLTAQLIDCGLAKFVQDDDTSTSRSTSSKGTKGYTCPEYESGEVTQYEAACDVFSFGVVMAELWTGKLQNSGATGIKTAKKAVNFSKKYAKRKEPMNVDLDPALDIDQSLDSLPSYLVDFADLSIACMAEDMEDRPIGEDVLEKLQFIWTECTREEGKMDAAAEHSDLPPTPELESEEETHITACRSCRRKNIDCQRVEEGDYLCTAICWGTYHAAKLANDRFARQSQVNHDILVQHLSAFRKETGENFQVLGGKVDAILPSLSRLEADAFQRIPRLFVIMPRQVGKGLPDRVNWLSSMTAQRLNMYFVCAHSHRAISKPIKLKVTHKWVAIIGPALVFSLKFLSIAGLGIDLGLGELVNNALHLTQGISAEQIEDMQEAAEKAMQKSTANSGKDDSGIVKRIHSGKLTDNDVQRINSDALKLVEEKAMENRQWEKEMVQVRLKDSTTTLWVMKEYAKLPEYVPFEMS
jgi:serine/threonine protein kinase